MTGVLGRIGAVGAALTVAAALGAAPAQAATGTIKDPRGDLPDIVRLTYDNGAGSVRMTMTYADVDLVQNESFHLTWGTGGLSYQVFESRAAGIRELRLHRASTGTFTTVGCTRLRVVHRDARNRTTVVVPRSCLRKAGNRLRFQGIATIGLQERDETRVSRAVRRG